MMARPITTVLCDLDGTLIDSRRDIALAFQYALRRIVEGALPDETAIAQHIGKPLEHMARELGYPLSPAQLTIFLDTYRSRYAAFCAHHTRPYPGVTATLHALSSLTFGVVTTKAQEQAETVLQQLQLTSFFQHIQGWVPGLQLKPAPDAVIAALAALRCAPQQALMVGDTTADILAGKAAGLKTCAVTYGFGSLAELQHCQPDYVIDTFSDLVRLVGAPEQSASRGVGFAGRALRLPRRAPLLPFRSHRVNHAAHLGDVRGRKAAALGMLVDERLTIRQVDAKSLVTSYVRVFPLDVFPLCLHLGEDRVRFLCRGAQRLALCTADSWNGSFNNISRHDVCSFVYVRIAVICGPIISYPSAEARRAILTAHGRHVPCT